MSAVVLAGCGSAEEPTGSPTTSQRAAFTTTSHSPAPPPAPLLSRRAGNGEVVQNNGLVGSGALRITNGNSADFAVVVTNQSPSAPQATIYVQGNSEATLNGIDGTYFVYLKSGVDWDPATLGFTRNRNFQKFDDPFDADSDWHITLQPTIGGNASTSDVPAF
ncbi:hypothetical protein NRB56_75210 [Nocardia sp. RB56]|uniref:Uncharacterized protein n=1 Tax=Nocardia aurantia TaxID=2585199 RepID=A0A7K0E1F9_9NOCA|nr:hypothetical protein [Nocardia aurantia]